MENSFTNTCRTCYQNKNDCLISLYETEQTEKSMYKDMLYDCTSIEIVADDNLPSVICKQCASLLTTAYKFKQECYVSNQKFKTILEEKCMTNPSNSIKSIEVINTTLMMPEEEHNSHLCDASNTQENTESLVDTWLSNDNEIETKESKLPLCSTSPKTFQSDDEMLEHKKLHSMQLDHSSSLQCKVCNKIFSTAATCERHMNVHMGLKRFVCSYCDTQFTQSGSLVRHMRNNHNLQDLLKIKKDEHHTCTYCGKVFRSTYDLTVHVRRHTGIKPYVCKVCNMSFVSMGRLTSHSRMHTGEKPFTCQTCRKAFSHSSTLYRHVQSHKKPHVCDFCEKRFTFSSCLEAHKLTHSGVKPHQCETCGKGFTERKLLQRHQVVHETDKPHLCNVCGNNFKRSDTLKKHLKNQHGIGKKLEDVDEEVTA